QTFRSKRGQRYRVSFSLAGPQDAEVPVKRMVVAAAGQSREFSCDSTGHSREDMGWDVKRWEFTATSDQTTQEFRTLEDKDPYHGPCLDDVSVSAVPGGKTVPAKETKSSAGDGWVDLFNGEDLSGWKTHPHQPGNWEVEDGAIVSRGNETSHLFSERGDYEDFHLRVEAQINAEGNSGVYFRSEYGLNLIAGRYPKGYEAQIFTGGGSDKQLTGSLHGFAPVKDKLVDADEWFT